MNRALWYFGGKKSLMITFVVSLVLYVVVYIVYEMRFLSYILILSEILFLVGSVLMWLGVKRIAVVIVTILSSVCEAMIIAQACFKFAKTNIVVDINIANIIILIFLIAGFLLDSLSLIILVIYENKKKYKMLFSFLVGLSVVFRWFCSGSMYNVSAASLLSTAATSTSDFSMVWLALQFMLQILRGVLVILLWKPLEELKQCPKCSYRNNKTAAFCGGCGEKLN